MKTTLPAAYFKTWFNRVSKCTITQDICTRLLGLLYTSVHQSYNKKAYFSIDRNQIFDAMFSPILTFLIFFLFINNFFKIIANSLFQRDEIDIFS